MSYTRISSRGIQTASATSSIFRLLKTYFPGLRSAFSRAYRQMLKDALKSDGNFPVYTKGCREYIILDSVMSGYIEMLLQMLDSDAVSMEEAFHFSYYTMENGTKPALKKRFVIT